MMTKDTNPKDAIGSTKPGLATVPSTALMALGAAHYDGARKYGAFNWRTAGVRASIYREAIDRHLLAWWEGENTAPDSLVHHLAHVMACCAILIDATSCDKLNDDRPTPSKDGWMEPYRSLREHLTSTVAPANQPLNPDDWMQDLADFVAKARADSLVAPRVEPPICQTPEQKTQDSMRTLSSLPPRDPHTGAREEFEAAFEGSPETPPGGWHPEFGYPYLPDGTKVFS